MKISHADVPYCNLLHTFLIHGITVANLAFQQEHIYVPTSLLFLTIVTPMLCACCRQVAPRHLLHHTSGSEAGFALFAFHHTTPSRLPINSHIVVAGASDCGLSIVESLLMHERLSFNAITMLAPGGSSKPGNNGLYNTQLIARLVSAVVFIAFCYSSGS